MRYSLRPLALALGCGLALAACTDPAVVDGQREIAGELRALRTVMQQASKQAPASVEAAPARAALDRQALATAMEPLREVLVALVADVDAMQTRQAALTDELKRWSQLVAQTATGGAKEEVTALVGRLEQLEQQMQTQDARHQQVENLLIEALDKTSERLEDFLKRLGELDGENVQPAEGGDPPPNADPGKNGPGDGEAATGAGTAEQRFGAARRPSTWWFAVAGVALLAGGVFALWLSRENRAAAAGPGGSGSEPAAAATDDGVRELWAAAALLGEAVGRLRENEGAAAGTDPAAGAAEPPGEDDPGAAIDLDDYFVIDEDPEDEPGRAAEAAPETAPDPEPTTILPSLPPATGAPADARAPLAGARPVELTLRLATTDSAAALQRVRDVLAADPRVLRRPAPAVVPRGNTLEITCALLPALPPGERAHVEVQLRDAVQ